jgi:hypothetical protein
MQGRVHIIRLYSLAQSIYDADLRHPKRLEECAGMANRDTGPRIRNTKGLNASAVASAQLVDERAMPFLAHLEELRRRTSFQFLELLVRFLLRSSFADQLFGLTRQAQGSLTFSITRISLSQTPTWIAASWDKSPKLSASLRRFMAPV